MEPPAGGGAGVGIGARTCGGGLAAIDGRGRPARAASGARRHHREARPASLERRVASRHGDAAARDAARPVLTPCPPPHVVERGYDRHRPAELRHGPIRCAHRESWRRGRVWWISAVQWRGLDHSGAARADSVDPPTARLLARWVRDGVGDADARTWAENRTRPDCPADRHWRGDRVARPASGAASGSRGSRSCGVVGDRTGVALNARSQNTKAPGMTSPGARAVHESDQFFLVIVTVTFASSPLLYFSIT